MLAWKWLECHVPQWPSLRTVIFTCSPLTECLCCVLLGAGAVRALSEDCTTRGAHAKWLCFWTLTAAHRKVWGFEANRLFCPSETFPTWLLIWLPHSSATQALNVPDSDETPDAWMCTTLQRSSECFSGKVWAVLSAVFHCRSAKMKNTIKKWLLTRPDSKAR